MPDFAERLHAAVRSRGTPALVGLDPRYDQLPQPVIDAAEARGLDRAETVAAAFEEFCLRIVDVVAPLVPAVKPQAAFFEEWGPAGCRALANVIRAARRQGLLVICDAKRGDIGSTAEAYARGYLAGSNPDAAIWGADALTINPYLGRDTLEPFVKVAVEREAGLYVLVRTSNPGAGTFQDLKAEGGERRAESSEPEPDEGARGRGGEGGQDRSADCAPLAPPRPGSLSPPQYPALRSPLYRHVARVVEELAVETSRGGDFGPIGAVVGATYPQELAELRAAMPHVPLLIPGYGSQGGTAADVAAAFRTDGLGAVINSSRGINFAYRREPYREQFAPDEWERAVEAATRRMIDDLAGQTPAGGLRGGG